MTSASRRAALWILSLIQATLSGIRPRNFICAAAMTRLLDGIATCYSPANSSLGWKKANSAELSAYTSGILPGPSLTQNWVQPFRIRDLLHSQNLGHNLGPF